MLKKQICVLVSCILVFSSLIPCYAAETQRKTLHVSEVDQTFVDFLVKNEVAINESTVLTEVYMRPSNDEADDIVTIQVTTRNENNLVEQSTVLLFGEDEAPGELYLDDIAAASVSAGYNSVNHSVSSAAYTVITTATFFAYNSSSTLYICPYGAAFRYSYNSGYSGAISITYTYYVGGEKCTYPGFTPVSSPYTHIVSVTKTNAVQNTTYNGYNYLGDSYVISIFDHEPYGIVSVTRNGVNYEYYVAVL